MPSLAEYRSLLSVECGPYIGPESYVVRATSNSDTTKLVCSQYPIRSGIPQNDLYTERPLYRPDALRDDDKHRYVMTYDPPTGTLTPDLPWTNPPIAPPGGSNYGYLETFQYGGQNIQPYGGLEQFLYEELEDLGATGVGERFEVLGPFDVPTTHRLINDGLKQCWLVVEVAAMPAPNVVHHDLRLIAPWLQDTTDVLQVGYLAPNENRDEVDPFERIVRGQVERDGGHLVLNTWTRSFQSGEVLMLRCLKRAYDHCRKPGGNFGDQSGLVGETDEAPVERDWLVSSALVIGWRRFGHMLEPLANARLIRDQATAAAWFTERCREHFTGPLPPRTLKRKRQFGPPVMSGT